MLGASGLRSNSEDRIMQPLAAALFALLLTGASPLQPAELKSVEAYGTEFKATFSDGRVLRSHDLVGARLVISFEGQLVRVRIDGVERDPDSKHSDVWLHSLSAQAADGTWQSLCGPGPDGRTQSFPVAGRARLPDGALMPAEAGAFEFTCTGGARGKCVRFGYRPWESAAAADLFNACVRMVRADYCGDGTATTKDGMLIDVYDDLGIQARDGTPGSGFEAGWTAEGAACVRHVRVKESTSPASLVAACPWLKDRVGETCSEEKARSLGARLFNWSKP